MIHENPYADEPKDRTCLVCGKNYIPAPFHAYKVYGKPVCSWSCQLKGEREGLPFYKGALPTTAVLMFNKDGRFLCRFQDAKKAADATGIFASNIRRCCRGVNKTAGGFVWKYEKDVQGSKTETEEEEKT